MTLFRCVQVADVSKKRVAFVLKMQGPRPNDEACPGSYLSQDFKIRIILICLRPFTIYEQWELFKGFITYIYVYITQ